MSRALPTVVASLLVTLTAQTSAVAQEGADEPTRPDLLTFARGALFVGLVRRGYAPATISATGVGESQPLLSPDADETSRELNCRVEISCE